MKLFPPDAVTCFAEHYPEQPHILAHSLCDHPLLQLDALADLAERLPAASIEYAHAKQPIGVTAKPPTPDIAVGDAIRQIVTSGCWVALSFIDHDPAYRALLMQLLAELEADIIRKTGPWHRPAAFLFISSPDAVTPYHFDPEHNILLQLQGNKVMTQFPAGNAAYAPDQVHEAYHRGGGRELTWRDDMAAGGRDFALSPGQALYVPVMAPHFVRNGGAPSVSLSITWRSEWSANEGAARALNGRLRSIGLNPRQPGRWPAQNWAKALVWRGLYRLGLR